MGNRLAIIEQAIAMIEHKSETRARVSPLIETEAWGYDSPNPFLNIVIAMDWDRTPKELIELTQGVEKAIDSSSHRDSNGNYLDRKIDIDILAIDSVELSTPELTIPHQLMHLRRFVLQPMVEIAPNWEHPRLKRSATQLLNSLEELSMNP